MPIAVLILLLGLAGLFLACIPYRLATRARRSDAGSAGAALYTALVACSRREYALLAGLVAGAAVLFWFALGDWRAPLAVAVGALCAASAVSIARWVQAQGWARGLPEAAAALPGGVVVGLAQGGLLLVGASALYLLLAFDPPHYADFTGFVLGAILATLPARFGGGIVRAVGAAATPKTQAESTPLQSAAALCLAGTGWFQLVAAALVAAFSLAVLLPATATMLIGPQAQLLLLPFALVAAGYLCAGVGMVMVLGGIGNDSAPRFALFTAGALFLPAGFGVMVFLDIYWHLWLCLAAGLIGGVVLLQTAVPGRVQGVCLSVGVTLVVALWAWLIVPPQAQAYGVSIAALGMLSGFSLYTTSQEADRSRRLEATVPNTGNTAIHHDRLSLSAGWLVVLLLTFVSVQFIYLRSPHPGFEWGDPRWMLGALLGLATVWCAAWVGLRAYGMAQARWRQDQGLARVFTPALGGSALCAGLAMSVVGLAGVVLGPWALCAALLGGLLACLLLVPLLFDWGGCWSKTRLRALCDSPGSRIAVAGELHLLVALMACTAHLIAQIL